MSIVIRNFDFFKKAISKDKTYPYKGICVQNDYIYTTDGFRLHAVKNEEKIPNGFYKVGVNNKDFSEIYLDNEIKNFPQLNSVYDRNTDKKLIHSQSVSKMLMSSSISLLLFKIFELSKLKFNYQYLVDAMPLNDTADIYIINESTLLLETKDKNSFAIIMSLRE